MLSAKSFAREISFPEASPRKRKSTAAPKAVDVMLMDMTGPISAVLWGECAEDICSAWRQVQERRQTGEQRPLVVALTRVRIMPATRNNWNGESLTNYRTLSSVEGVKSEEGTTVTILEEATSEYLTETRYKIPPMNCCATLFRTLRGRMKSPFRLTAKGKIVDLQDMEYTQSGNPKRVFQLVDSGGLYFTVCAMQHNAQSSALRNFQDVVVYFGAARGPIGSYGGMLYLMKDAMMIPIGSPCQLGSGLLEHLAIT